MVKKVILLAFSFFFFQFAKTQIPYFFWAKNMGGSSSVEGRSIITDSLGNIYTIGTFQGTADFDPDAETFNLSAAGTSDIFVQKYCQCTIFSFVFCRD